MLTGIRCNGFVVFARLFAAWSGIGPFQTKKPLTRVSKPVPGAHGKRGFERVWQKRLAKGWQKRLAEKVGRKGWQKRLAEKVGRKGWRRVGEELADFLAPSSFGIPEAPV